MEKHAITRTRIAVASAVCLSGILFGALHNVDGGKWAIRRSKEGSPLGPVIALCSMCGTALSYQTTGDMASPLPFWLGQLGFYSLLFLAILKVKKRRRRKCF